MIKKVPPFSITILGSLLTAVAISIFYIPNKIVSGGVSGVSTLLYYLLSLPAGISYGFINLLLLLIGFRYLGKRFVLNTLLGASILSVFVQIFSYFPPLTTNVFLATVFGAVLYGMGIGLTLISGASTGGSDILGRLIQYKFPHMPIGRLLMFVDGIVILASLAVFHTIDLVLYGILALFVATYSIDFLIKKLNISKLAFVISDQGMEISQRLVSISPRGVTILNVMGAYKKEESTMLICALKENELTEFRKNVLAMDPAAFVIFSESQQIIGNGFHVYK